MGRTEQGEFIEVRNRKPSGGKRGRNSNSSQRIHHQTRMSSSAAASGLPVPAGRAGVVGPSQQQQKSRRSSIASSTGSECSSTSGCDGVSEDLDEVDDPGISNPGVNLGSEAVESGMILEMLIIESLANHPEMSLFKASGSQLNKLQFSHPEGDLLSWLNVTRKWVTRLQTGTAESWYKENHVQEVTLRNVERYVEARRKFLSNQTRQPISLAFCKDPYISNEIISNIILQKYCHNFCIYYGHPSLGYKAMSTGNTVFIHPSSSVFFLTKMPNYITFIDTPNNKTKEVKAVMVLSDVMVMSLLEFNYRELDVNTNISKDLVKPCVFEHVGESIANELEQRWKDEDHVKEPLETILKYQCNDSPLLLEKGPDPDSVTVFAQPEYHRTITNIVRAEIEQIRQKYQDECVEFRFPHEKSHFRILLGPGATNDRLLLYAHDFRSVWIHETKPGVLSRDFVLAEMNKYGGVVEDLRISNKVTKLETGIWATVTFRNPDDVIKLLASYKSHNAAMLIELAPNNDSLSLSPSLVTINRSVKINVRLCRRPAKSGLAYVTIKGKRDLGIVLNTKSLTIQRRRITVSVCAGKSDVILLSGLGPLIEADQIADAIKEKFNIEANDIHVERPEAFACSVDDLHKFKTSLQRLIDKAMDANRVQVRVFMPSPEDLYIRAELKFHNRRSAISSLDYIAGANIRGIPLEIQNNPLENPDVPTISIKIAYSVYQSVKTEIKKQLQTTPPQVSVQMVIGAADDDDADSGDRMVTLLLFSQYVAEAESVATRLVNILTPHELGLGRKKIEVLVKAGEPFLNSVMADTKTYIKVDRENRRVSIYGKSSHVAKAKKNMLENIDKFTENQQENSGAAIYYKLPLEGVDKPASLMIDVMGKLDELVERTGVSNLKLDVKSRALCYTGSDEEHFAMQAMIGSLCDMAQTTCHVIPASASEMSEPRDCSACYCPIEGALYSLQACGHDYCEECINTHVKVSLENKSFPITCVADTCSLPICVKDVTLLSRKLDRGLFKVLKSAADHYVQTKPKEYGFCRKPNCPGIVPKIPGALAYFCPLCLAKLCPLCLNSYHGNESCDDHFNNTSFKEWMSGSPDRKKCPNCDMAIEKVDGCNRIHCTNCHRHICWKCLAHFEKMTPAYDHLNKEHGGYM